VPSGQVLADIVLDLVLIDRLHVISAAGLPIDQLRRGFAAHGAGIGFRRVFFFDVENLLHSFFELFHLALTSGHGHLWQRVGNIRYSRALYSARLRNGYATYAALGNERGLPHLSARLPAPVSCHLDRHVQSAGNRPLHYYCGYKSEADEGL
jgi:hypothetical protein